MKNVKLIIGGVLLSCITTKSFALQEEQFIIDGTPVSKDDYYRPHRCPKPTSTPKVSYNTSSTALNVSFPGNSQGGKVEIYHNGVRVVSASAPAGTSLSYVLLNYGKGDYTIIVSQGNMVVYSNNVIVK